MTKETNDQIDRRIVAIFKFLTRDAGGDYEANARILADRLQKLLGHEPPKPPRGRRK